MKKADARAMEDEPARFKQKKARGALKVYASNVIRGAEQAAINRAKVEKLVLSRGLAGIQMGEMLRRLDLSETAIRRYLMELREAGVLERTHPGGQSCRWGAPGIYDAFAAEREAGKRETDKQKAKRDRKQQREAEAVLAEAWAEEPAVRLLVSASEVPPIKRTGPNSVWQLAA